MSTESRFSGRQLLVLAGITAVAAALRLFRLGEWSLWIDEAHTYRDATMRLDGEGGFLRSDRVFYPLTFLVLRVLLGLGWLGSDEGALRLPFALTGIVTVPLLALCGCRLVGPWSAVLAAGLLAINPWHVFWSQNARGYVVVVLATVIAINRAHKWLGSERNRDLYAAVGAIALGALSHPSAMLLAIAFVGFLFVRHSLRIGTTRRLVWRTVILALLLVITVPWLIEDYSPFQGFVRAKASPSLLHFVETTAYFFRPPMLLCGLIGAVLAPYLVGRERGVLLVCLWALPLLALGAVGVQLVKVTARYAICTLPVLMWLAALAMTHLTALAGAGQRAPGRARAVLGAFVPLLVASDSIVWGLEYYGAHHGQRARWREAVAGVRSEVAPPGLRVLTVSQPTMQYYLRPRHWTAARLDPHPGITVVPLVDWMIENGLDEGKRRVHDPGAEGFVRWHVEQARAGAQQLAVIVTLPELAEQDRRGDLRRILARDFDLVLHLPCWVGPKDESIYVYRPRRT